MNSSVPSGSGLNNSLNVTFENVTGSVFSGLASETTTVSVATAPSPGGGGGGGGRSGAVVCPAICKDPSYSGLPQCRNCPSKPPATTFPSVVEMPVEVKKPELVEAPVVEPSEAPNVVEKEEKEVVVPKVKASEKRDLKKVVLIVLGLLVVLAVVVFLHRGYGVGKYRHQLKSIRRVLERTRK